MWIFGSILVVVAFGIYLTERWLGPLLPWSQEVFSKTLSEALARVDDLLAAQAVKQEQVQRLIDLGQTTLVEITARHAQELELSKLFYEASKEPLTELMAAITERVKPAPTPDMGEPMPEPLQKWIQGWHDPYAQEDQRGRAEELFKELGNWDSVAMQIQSESEGPLDGDDSFRILDQ